MQLTELGKRSGLCISRAAIGAMRLPNDDSEAVELLRYAIDSGMSYIDTSPDYCAERSEIKVGKALIGAYRQRAMVSTKSSAYGATSDEIRRSIETSLQRMGLSYIDFFQVWNLRTNDQWAQATARNGMVDGIRAAIRDGMVRHTGITVHAAPQEIIPWLEQGDWVESVLVSFNMANTKYGIVLDKAKQLGIGTMVMNPVAGGKFTGSSTRYQALLEEIGCGDLANLALRYVSSQVNVNTLLVGITRESDVDSAVRALEMKPLTAHQLQKVDDHVQGMDRSNVQGFCTWCKYCLPCPQNISIPRLLDAFFELRYLDMKNSARQIYDAAVRKRARPSDCIHCGMCEEKCTQKLKIMDFLTELDTEFGQTQL